ncbi:MAG: type II toxin-antitoxin system RelE/ParE family toxin [Candidatus Sungbacteria bacterium]|nr:type II toxin-antitoxin system RelE/ParE family toxin [Candidatus Sungbacteria bacterium]
MPNGTKSNETWRVVVNKSAQKQIDRIPDKDAKRISGEVEGMGYNPFLGDIVKLGDYRWRRRVGNYRIMYNILPNQRVIFIYDIRRRTSSTY